MFSKESCNKCVCFNCIRQKKNEQIGQCNACKVCNDNPHTSFCQWKSEAYGNKTQRFTLN